MIAALVLNSDGTPILTEGNDEDSEDDNDIPEEEQNDMWEPTREAFLCRMRWEDDTKGWQQDED